MSEELLDELKKSGFVARGLFWDDDPNIRVNLNVRGYQLSVIALASSYEVALIKNGSIVYNDELGYADVCRFGTAHEIVQEATRVQAGLRLIGDRNESLLARATNDHAANRAPLP